MIIPTLDIIFKFVVITLVVLGCLTVNSIKNWIESISKIQDIHDERIKRLESRSSGK